MSRGELSSADLAPYMDLLTSPAFRWGQTESDDETEGLWVQLSLAILEGIPGETLKWFCGLLISFGMLLPRAISQPNRRRLPQTSSPCSRWPSDTGGVGITARKNLN